MRLLVWLLKIALDILIVVIGCMIAQLVIAMITEHLRRKRSLNSAVGKRAPSVLLADEGCHCLDSQ